MLRISKLADYGTVIMVHLAFQKDRLCNAKEIAKATHINVPTVSKLLKKLTQAGLLFSERGVKGGYRLVHEADKITVADILSALEERTGLTECAEKHGLCTLQSVCRIQSQWQLINKAIAQALNSVSLKALMQTKTTKVELKEFQQLFSKE